MTQGNEHGEASISLAARGTCVAADADHFEGVGGALSRLLEDRGRRLLSYEIECDVGLLPG